MLTLTTVTDMWLGGALTLGNLLVGFLLALAVRQLLRGQAPTHD